MKTIEVKDILSISGKGGLFRYIAQARNGMIVESIEDKKRQVAPASAKVHSMDEIAVFTDGEEVPLCDVLYKIYEKESGKPCISHKSGNDELKAYFREVLPNYDDERVYISDIRKILNWYNILQEHDLLNLIDREEEPTDETEGGDTAKQEEENDKNGE